MTVQVATAEALIAEAQAWLDEDCDDDQTEIVSERVTSLIHRLSVALQAATAEPVGEVATNDQ